MPLTIAQGILGTEALVVWNGFVLNDREAVLPRTFVKSIPNLYDLPDADDNLEKKVNQIGEILRPSLSRGKTINYECVAYGNDALELRAYVKSIRSAFAGTPGTPAKSTYGEMVHQPHGDYGSIAWGYGAKVIAFNMNEDPSQNTDTDVISKYKMPYSFSVRNLDGRFYVTEFTDVGPFDDGDTHVEFVDGEAFTDPIIYGRVDGTTTTKIAFENLTIPVFYFGEENAIVDYRPNPAAAFVPGEYTFDWAKRRIDVVPDTGLGDPFDAWTECYQWDASWTIVFVPGLIPGNNSIKVVGLNDWHLKYRVRDW